MAQFEFHATEFSGCYLIQPIKRSDNRGYFVKTFHLHEFETLGLETNFVESYFSWSKRDVIRGLHFQTPPHDHAKLVYCPMGQVLDVVVDLRLNSPTFQKVMSIQLSETQANMLYIPSGIAHGFAALSQALLVYSVTSIHEPAHDAGIRWDSIPFDWQIRNPIVSTRDREFPRLTDFTSPF
jgi:dTDP-4-dehydrorhamnose 3,5-epimerase